MNCMDISEKMSLYIDNLLTEEENRLFEKHLSECSECKAAFNIILNNTIQLKKMPQAPLPMNFKEDLELKLEKERQNKEVPKRDWRKYGLAVAVVMVMVISAVQGHIMDKDITDKLSKNESDSHSIGTKWTLANDSDKTLQDKMEIAVPEESDVQESQENTLRFAMVSEEEKTEDKTSYANVAQSEEDADLTKKAYQGHVNISNDTIENVLSFIEVYSKNNDVISIYAEEEVSLNAPEIRLVMPSDAFDESLNYILEYTEVTHYNVDIISTDNSNDSVESNTDVNQLTNLPLSIITIDITQ